MTCQICTRKNDTYLASRPHFAPLCTTCVQRLREQGRPLPERLFRVALFCSHCGAEQPYVALCSDCGTHVFGYRAVCSGAPVRPDTASIPFSLAHSRIGELCSAGLARIRRTAQRAGLLADRKAPV